MPFLSPQHRGETLSLVLLTVTGVTLLVGAASLPDPMFDPLGPAGLPRWIGWLLLALVAARLVVFVREVLATSDPGTGEAQDHDARLADAGKGESAPAGNDDAPQIIRLLVAAGITLAYVAILAAKVLPFVWVTMAFVAALGAVMSDLSPRKLITVGVIAVVMSLALTYVFADVLSVVLPQ